MIHRRLIATMSAATLCLLCFGTASALAAPPTITLTTFSKVTATSATLEADIDPEGKITRYRFEYGLADCELSNCTSVPVPEGQIPAGTDPIRVGVPVEGLSAGTTYHFRVVAKTSNTPTDVAEGPDTTFTTFFVTPAGLPDGRAYEQVSPVHKNGLDVTGIPQTVRSSPDGNRATFVTHSGVPGGVGGQKMPTYLATRGADWTSAGILPPESFGPNGQVLGWTPDFSQVFSEARLYAEPTGTKTFLSRSSTGALTTIFPHTVLSGYSFAGAAADGSKVFFESQSAPLTPEAAPGTNNLYAWERGTGKVGLVGRTPSGSDLQCAEPACVTPAGGSFAGPYDWVNENANVGGAARDYYTQAIRAISADGSRVAFSAGKTGQLYLRQDPASSSASTTHVSASQKTNGQGPGGTDAAGPRPAAFMAATPDASKVFFTSPEKLTNDANTGLEPPLPTVARAKLTDGKEVDLDFLADLRVTGLASSGTHIYWSGPGALPGEYVIGRAKLNGSGAASEVDKDFIVLPEIETAPGVFAGADPQGVAVSATHVYWVNSADKGEGTGTIGRAKIGASEGEEVTQTYVTGITNPSAVAVNATHVYWTSLPPQGKQGLVGRAKLGASGGEEVEPEIVKTFFNDERPSGIALSAEHVYFLSTEANIPPFNVISRAKLDGSEYIITCVFPGDVGGHGVSVQGESLYWSAAGAETIGRAKLDCTGAEKEFIKGAEAPRALATDSEHIFWGANQEIVPNPGNDLYRYDVGSKELTDLTVLGSAKNGAEVRGVVDASADGSRVYFVANGALTAVPNEEGEAATAGDCPADPGITSGTCNLYLSKGGAVSEGGTVSFVARLSNGGNEFTSDALNWTGTVSAVFPDAFRGEKPARTTPDGATLLFRSQRQLTDYDNNGKPELYRYEADSGELECVSCVPTGEAPIAVLPSGIRTAALNPSPPAETLTRSLSADGSRVFFESTDRLLLEDVNGEAGCPLVGSDLQDFRACQDVYMWQAKGSGSCKGEDQNGGCLSLISTGQSPAPSFFIDASANGSDAFFVTREQLVGQDGDQLFDLYDARIGGGIASQNEEEKEPCPSIDGCHGGATPPPAFQSPGTPSFVGPPDPAPKRGKCPKGKRKATVKGKARCVRKRGKGRRQATRPSRPHDREDSSVIARKAAAAAIATPGLFAGAAAQAPAQLSKKPVLQISSIAMPTNFPAGAKHAPGSGPEYFVIATNVGAAPTEGPDPVVLEVELPSDIEVANLSGTDNDPDSADPSCGVVAQTVTCETTGPLHPGRWLGTQIRVNVANDAEGTQLSDAVVEGGGAEPATSTISTEIDDEAPDFNFLPGPDGFASLLSNTDGSAATQAGSHPHQLTVNLGFTVEKIEGQLVPVGHLRDLRFELPRGVIANPTATSELCTEAELTIQVAGCPAASQVGTVAIMTTTPAPSYDTQPLFNMVPPPGVPGEFAFDAEGAGVFIHLMGSVRSDGDYGLSAEANDVFAPAAGPILSTQTQLWGNPSSPDHDQIRGACFGAGGSCPVDPVKTALLTMPSDCTGPITTKTSVDSWEKKDIFIGRSVESRSIDGAPAGVEGCNQLEFKPSFEADPTTDLIDSPSGLRFKLHQPQNFDPEGNSTSALKDALVALPEGMVVNPAQADGLAACSAQQIGMLSAVGETPVRLSKQPNQCPDAAKIGTVEVSTPLLARIDEIAGEVLRDPDGKAIPRPVEGSVYVAKPFDNPFDTLLAIYIVIEDAQSGTVAKLAGRVEPDPVTGQLRSRFTENPQLPLEDVELRFFEGPRAALISPPACATQTTTSELVPWGAPETSSASPTDSFAPVATPVGGSCPAAAEQAPFSPSFTAGTLSPQAAAFSPFTLRVAREDGTQRLKGLKVTLPPGMTGKLAGVPSCTDDQIALAESRGNPNQGAIELADPSCPAASQVGTATVGAGAGPLPYYVQGKVYLAGPYKGAPVSFVIVTPAVAGPFDLGTVVVRAALRVDPRTAQITADSDPVPTILHGIPVSLRSAVVQTDRPNFTLNPTSCDPMAVSAEALSVFGQAAQLSDRFQVGGCGALPFRPKLSLRLIGGTKRGGHPRLRAVLSAKPGEANIARTSVALSRASFLDQSHIRTVCTRVQFAAEQCPKGAIYGHVRATTPLLDEVLEGPVYLRSSDNELPDSVAVLKGPPSRPIQIEVVARIDSIKGGIRANFETVPDAPIKEVIVTMQGGSKGLLINSRNLCAKRHRATVKMDGQNGKAHDFRPVVGASCGKSRKRKRGSAGR